MLNTAQLTIGSTTIKAEIADTDAAQEKGLSGRFSLPEGQGMLFVFDEPGAWGIWMKDMNFPIDIVFVDEAGGVVSVEKNISPDTYQQNPPKIFYPPLAVKYVLELPAGYADAHDIGPESKVKF